MSVDLSDALALPRVASIFTVALMRPSLPNSENCRLKGGRGIRAPESPRSRRLAKIHVRAFDGKIPGERVTAPDFEARAGVILRRIAESGRVDILDLRLPKHTEHISAGVGGECRDRDRRCSQYCQDVSLCHLILSFAFDKRPETRAPGS